MILPLSMKIVIGLYIWGLFATIFHDNPGENLKEMREIWLTFPILLLANFYWKRAQNFTRVFHFFLWGAFFSGIIGILEYVTYIDAKNILKYGFTQGFDHPKIHLPKKMGGGEVAGFMGNPLTYAGLMIIPVFYHFLQYFYPKQKMEYLNDDSNISNRWLHRPYMWILYFFNLFASGSRSAILGIFSALSLSTFIYSKKVFVIFLSASVILLGVFFTISESARNRMGQIFVQKEIGVRQRFVTYSNALKIIEAAPVFGKGPMNFQSEYRKNFPKEKSFRHAHNDLLQKGASWGIPGLLIFLSLYFFPAYRFWKMIRDENQFVAFYSALALFTVVAFFVSGFFQCYLTDSEDLVHFSLALGMGEMMLRRKNLLQTDKKG